MAIVFKDNSAKFKEAYPAAITKALNAIGATGEKYAKRDTPVDTGRLRNSVGYAVSGSAAYVGANTEYAPYVELGTRYAKGHHMIQKACQNHSGEYKQIAMDALKKG